MNLTATRLAAAAGAFAVAAGSIFVAVQINHPPLDLEHIGTSEMVARQTAKAVMAVLALAGITGMFVWHRDRLGILGLVGYVTLSIGFLAMFAVQCVAAFVLPTVATIDPGYVQKILDEAVGGAASGEIGRLHELLVLSGIGYLLGGLLFGIALFRTGSVPRWAAALLALGTTSTLALAVLPVSFNRLFAIPTGIALIGLGMSLWRDARRQ